MLTTAPRETAGNLVTRLLGVFALAAAVALATAAPSGAPLAHGEEEHEQSPFHFETVHGPYLGVSVRDETEGGVRVVFVIDGSPAAEGGIEDGDVIVEIDGEAIRDRERLTELIHGKQPGDKIRIDVLRDGGRESLQVAIGDRSETRARTFVFREDHFPGDDPGLADRLREMVERLGKDDWSGKIREFSGPGTFQLFVGRPRLGVQLVETTRELREHLGGAEDAGVLVSKVLPDTPAAEAGVKVGDLILSVDGENVSSSAELVTALADKDGEVELKVVRDRKTVTLRPKLAADGEETIRGPRARRLVRHEVEQVV